MRVQKVLLRAYYRAIKAVGPLRPPMVVDEWTTLSRIIDERLSISRYGDGEIMLMYGHDLRFQTYDSRLAKRLKATLQRDQEDLLVGIPNLPQLRITVGNVDRRKKEWEGIARVLSHVVNRRKTYYSAFVTRPSGIHGLLGQEYFTRFRMIWDKRHVVVISGNKRLEGHTFFDNAARVDFLPCAESNCFQEYEKILGRIGAVSTKESVCLVSAGPAATVLVADLARSGVQAVDFGQIVGEWDQYRQALPSACAGRRASDG